ncbi:hypothetical protein DL766_009041 [Monosporascus sp. MC13-8B]|uniref:Uncharacterized protein n=1 Tax=Monosporascus cannonballus TaxID=155416 RepID=A0ABY0H504_9PEZI|nr:hypothetical protein DL762_005402 [Monosporascus cannonballus]RYP00653.1 hypothetical protein DL763_000707 [Monosporascus cannonballus]RYP16776.1 hypothetical protein DL766_009041 [Monosporascus sp. MC13-8B]
MHGAGRHVNANVSVMGAPLLRFLAFAAEVQMRAPLPDQASVGGGEQNCEHLLLDVFRDKSRILAKLGEICLLLIAAGTHIPFDGYEDGTTSVPRLLRLLGLHTVVLNEECEKSQGRINRRGRKKKRKK